MIYNLKTTARKKWFNFRCRAIYSDSPLQTKPSGLAIVTMMCHADLVMYLVSIKSFYRRLGHGKIFILNDGSLLPEDIETLNHHLSSPTIIPISGISTGACPKGGCWERILLVSQLAEEYFVVQLDADIVTVGPVSEIQDAYDRKSSFTLGTPQGLKFGTLQDAARFVKDSPSQHVQTQSEQAFGKLPAAESRKYVRGCAGFAGFAKNSITRAGLEAFSREMETSIGPRWKSWGSEQVTSNYMVANTPGAIVLPFPRFSSYEPGVDSSGSSLVHFYGPHRFADGMYIRKAREYIFKKGP